jgi:acetyltransferase-like isoleucine patch superfamily enzyme
MPLLVLAEVRRAWARSRGQSLAPTTLASRGVRFLLGVACAPVYLRRATELGAGVRTLGAPHVDNRGHLAIGCGTLLHSEPVAVQLMVGEGARLDIGADGFLNYGVSVCARASIRIGDRCLLGPYARLADSEFFELGGTSELGCSQPITLEDDVWVGAKATVLPGVTIGRGAVVGVAALVTEDVEPFTVVAGVPARLVRRLDPRRFTPSTSRASSSSKYPQRRSLESQATGAS